jgi:hypothetical protein
LLLEITVPHHQIGIHSGTNSRISGEEKDKHIRLFFFYNRDPGGKYFLVLV